MDVKNYNRNRKKPVRKKGLRIVAFLLLFIGVVLAVFRYYKFMSKSIYEESVSHLTEVLHQSDQMLRELTNKNLTYLHIWARICRIFPVKTRSVLYKESAGRCRLFGILFSII